MDNDKSNVTIGLPKPGGALYWAPAGTTLPTAADTALTSDFVNLGYVTSDGLTATVAEDGDDIKDWGNEPIMRSQTGYKKTYTTNLMESSRVAVLQFIYGKDNVTVAGDGSIKWDETGEQLPRGVFVCDTLQNNGNEEPRIHRQVVGDAQFVDRSGDHTYNGSDPLSFPIALQAFKFTAADSKRTFVRNYLSALPSGS